MNRNEKILDAIRRYALCGIPEQALLLYGEWGCGKTYYVKNVVMPILREQGWLTVYVSLAGVESPENIIVRILEEVSTKTFKRSIQALRLFKNFSFSLPLVNVDTTEGVGAAEDYFSKMSIAKLKEGKAGLFLCLDDLERSIATQDNILAFVLNNISGEIADRVMYICHEEKVSSGAYPLTKEKYIERSMVLLSDPMPVIESRVNENSVLYPYREDLLSIVTEIGEKNLRTVEYGLRLCEEVVEKLSIVSLEGISHLMYFLLTVASTEKNAELSAIVKGNPDIINFEAGFDPSFFGETSRQSTPLSRFYQRYVSGVKYAYRYYRSIYDLVIDGYLDEQLLKSEYQKYIERQSRNVDSLERLHDFRGMSQEDLENTFNELYTALTNNHIPLEMFPRLSRTVEYFSSVGLLLNKTKAEWRGAIDQSLDDLMGIATAYKHDYDRYGKNSDDPATAEMDKKLCHYAVEQDRAKVVRQYEMFKEEMQEHGRIVSETLTRLVDQNIADALDVSDLVSDLLSLDMKVIDHMLQWLVANIKRRRTIRDENEKEWVRKLNELMCGEVANIHDLVRRHVWQECIDELSKMQ